MKILLILILIFNTSQLYAAEEDSSRLDKNIAQEADSQLTVDPLTTIAILSSVPDCDDKYALMHKANVEIAKKCRWPFHYHANISPQELDKLNLNKYEKHVIENQEKFDPAGEVKPVTANSYWIKKIKNPENPAIANYKWDTIKQLYDAAWEDGDGSMHSYILVRKFTEWINAYPNHPSVKEAKGLITFLKRSDIYKTHEILVGTWAGEFRVKDDKGNVLASHVINFKISGDNPNRGEFTDRIDNNSWETTLGVGIEKVNMTFGFERRWFTLERDAQEYLLRTNYKSRRQGHVLQNDVFLKKQ